MVEHQCTWHEVIFQSRISDNQQYFEWMAPCKVESLTTKNDYHYYVSRAYRDDAVLVYDVGYRSEGKTVIVKMFTHVNIDDNGESSKTADSPPSMGGKGKNGIPRSPPNSFDKVKKKVAKPV